MKLIAVIILPILFTLSSAAQDKTDRANPGNLAEKTYRLNPKEAAQSLSLPFSQVKVIDARFDTTKIGFVTVQGSLTRKLNLETGLAAGLENYFQFSTGLSNSDSLNLLIVVKKFWISLSAPLNYEKSKTSSSYALPMSLHAKWELYLFKGNEYLPFRRIDTLIKNDQPIAKLFNHENNKVGVEENIHSILRHFLSQFSYEGAMKVFDERNKKSLAEIIAANNTRFEIPVLKAAKINKGIYLSFEEFKNNQPSITAFTENTMTTGLSRKDIYLTTSNGITVSKYFVYNNGEKTMAGGNQGEVIFRNGDSFEFFLRTRIATPRSPGDMVIGNHITYRIPYQVDMEGGGFY